jgi:P4 family phage/plasmid primase-like protien
MRRHSGTSETPETHHAYAEDVLRQLTVAEWPPVFYEGCLYAVHEASGLWLRREQTEIERLAATRHDGKPNCTKRSDYTGIALHALSLVARQGFFTEAPVGLACPDGFYRVSGTDTVKEPLDPGHRQRVRVEFSPTDIPTPHFDAFLEQTFRADDPGEQAQQIALVQEIAGAVMLGLMHTYQKAVLFYDPYGRAGKGTLESILRHLVPRSFVTAVSPFAWNKEYYVMALAGSRFNVVGELPDGQSIPAANFKTVIGGDLVTGRNPAGRPVTFRSEAAHLFMSNHLINTREHSEAFFARWLIVEFPNSRLKSGLPIDPHVASRIVDAGELPGIAHWALVGAQRLLRGKAFTKSEAHVRLMEKWRRTSSSLEEYVHECCLLGESRTARRSEFYRDYKSWCSDNGRIPFSKSKLKELMLSNVGLRISCSELNGYETFRGVSIKEPAATDPLDLY